MVSMPMPTIGIAPQHEATTRGMPTNRSRTTLEVEDALVDAIVSNNSKLPEHYLAPDEDRAPGGKRRKNVSYDEQSIPLGLTAHTSDTTSLSGIKAHEENVNVALGPPRGFPVESLAMSPSSESLSEPPSSLLATDTDTNKPQLELTPHAKKGTKASGKGVQIQEWPAGRKVIWQRENPGKALPNRATAPKHCQLGSHAPDPATDISYLGGHEVTAVELLTYFPHHTIWREVMWRLSNNGWNDNDIVQYILWSRGISNPKALRTTKLIHQNSKAKEWAQAERKSLDNGRVTKFGFPNTSDARGNTEVLHDYRLKDLADGVVHRPEGKDAYILTAAIALAVERDDDVLLSGFSDYVKENWDQLNTKWTLEKINNQPGRRGRRQMARIKGSP